MTVRSSIAAAALVLAASACTANAGDGAPTAAPALPRTATAAAGQPRLVFFMNPNGMPCQMQDQVLRQMGPDLSSRATLVYYRTTQEADLAQFGRYGIRSLPALVVTDASGRELRRATPGIHSADEIRQLLAP